MTNISDSLQYLKCCKTNHIGRKCRNDISFLFNSTFQNYLQLNLSLEKYQIESNIKIIKRSTKLIINNTYINKKLFNLRKKFNNKYLKYVCRKSELNRKKELFSTKKIGCDFYLIFKFDKHTNSLKLFKYRFHSEHLQFSFKNIKFGDKRQQIINNSIMSEAKPSIIQLNLIKFKKNIIPKTKIKYLISKIKKQL